MKAFEDKVFLSRVEDLTDSGCRSFSIDRSGEVLEGFIIKIATEFRAYLNQCPHTGINLNWKANEFFDITGEYIQCCMHGALFLPLTGLCIYGPCVNQSLSALEVVIESESLYLII